MKFIRKIFLLMAAIGFGLIVSSYKSPKFQDEPKKQVMMDSFQKEKHHSRKW